MPRVSPEFCLIPSHPITDAFSQSVTVSVVLPYLACDAVYAGLGGVPLQLSVDGKCFVGPTGYTAINPKP
jgi:hypothetical protein